MIKVAAILSLLCALGGCALAAPAGTYSVEEVIADISSADSKLDGKTIAIRGWLGECGGLDCAIYSSRDDWAIVKYADSSDKRWSAVMDRRLNIGAGDGFDLSATAMQNSEVVVVGEINAVWKKPVDENGNKFGCLDRCNDINPHSIRSIIF